MCEVFFFFSKPHKQKYVTIKIKTGFHIGEHIPPAGRVVHPNSIQKSPHAGPFQTLPVHLVIICILYNKLINVSKIIVLN